MVFKIKNTLRTLKVLFGLENKNMKPSKKNDVLIKKKVYYLGYILYTHLLASCADHVRFMHCPTDSRSSGQNRDMNQPVTIKMRGFIFLMKWSFGVIP